MEPVKNESKKQSSNPQPEKAAASRMADGEAIQVYEIVFRQPHPDMGFEGGSSGRFRANAMKKRTISYYPRLHLYRLEERYSDKEPKVVFVPREWGSFEPLADHHEV